MAGIEVGGQDLGNQALDLVAAVKHPVAVGVQDCEGAPAKGHHLVEVAHGQPDVFEAQAWHTMLLGES